MHLIRGGIAVPPGGEATVVVDTGRKWIRQGSIIQGRLITEGGQSFPFTARTPIS